MQNFLDLEDENDIKVYQDLAPKAQNIHNEMFEKAKNNVENIHIDPKFDEEYKKFCKKYLE
jgi:hypothetical protein